MVEVVVVLVVVLVVVMVVVVVVTCCCLCFCCFRANFWRYLHDIRGKCDRKSVIILGFGCEPLAHLLEDSGHLWHRNGEGEGGGGGGG